MIDLMCTQQIPNKYSNVAGVCKILHLSHSFHKNPNMCVCVCVCVCVYGCVYAQHKKESARGCRNPGSNLLVWNKYIDIDLEPKLCPLHTLGHPFMQKAFENSESCLLSPKLAATHISSISASGGACTIPTNLHCKSEKTEVILKSIECQKKQERDPPKWPRVTNKKRTHQKKCRPQQPAVPSPRLLDTLHQVAFWCCHGF